MRLVGCIPGREGTWEVTIEAGKIRSVRAAPADARENIDRPLWLAPGFLDIQVNGFSGVDLNEPSITVEGVERMVRSMWATGAALVLPTVITGPFDRMCHSLRTIARLLEEADRTVSASVAGIHLEGPYISPEDGPRGAHPREFVRPPDWKEFQRLQEAASGNIRLITLAPEWPQAIDFIERAVSAGVVIAIGHTGASTDQIAQAVSAGARISTHLGNGAHAMIRRHPNYIWDQLACDELWASFIADGFHLPPAVLRTFVRAKGVRRSILVTDAVSVAGLAPGVYSTIGAQVELLPSGRVQLVGTEYLAGSALTLDRAVSNVMRFTGVDLASAVAMVTTNPAEALGLSARTGSLRSGMEANLTAFRITCRGDVEVELTVVQGQVVYHRGGP